MENSVRNLSARALLITILLLAQTAFVGGLELPDDPFSGSGPWMVRAWFGSDDAVREVASWGDHFQTDRKLGFLRILADSERLEELRGLGFYVEVDRASTALIRRAEVKLRDVFDREPTDEEVAHELDLDAKRVRQYREASRAPVSLDAPIGEGESNRVSELIADPNATNPFDQVSQGVDTDLVREVLATLTERESSILSMRFGLDGNHEMTLEDIGERFGVTRERIRQIQELALKKLRTKMEERDNPDLASNASFAVAA